MALQEGCHRLPILATGTPNNGAPVAILQVARETPNFMSPLHILWHLAPLRVGLKGGRYLSYLATASKCHGRHVSERRSASLRHAGRHPTGTAVGIRTECRSAWAGLRTQHRARKSKGPASTQNLLNQAPFPSPLPPAAALF